MACFQDDGLADGNVDTLLLVQATHDALELGRGEHSTYPENGGTASVGKPATCRAAGDQVIDGGTRFQVKRAAKASGNRIPPDSRTVRSNKRVVAHLCRAGGVPQRASAGINAAASYGGSPDQPIKMEFLEALFLGL